MSLSFHEISLSNIAFIGRNINIIVPLKRHCRLKTPQNGQCRLIVNALTQTAIFVGNIQNIVKN